MRWLFPDGYKTNYDTVLRAAGHGDLALIECKVQATGEPAFVLAAVYQDEQDLFNIVPLARLFDGNPYEELIAPSDPRFGTGVGETEARP